MDSDSKGGFYMIEEMLAYNKKFVEEKRYEQYAASKYPNKKVAILTCMDTRLVELLPAALGIKNEDDQKCGRCRDESVRKRDPQPARRYH